MENIRSFWQQYWRQIIIALCLAAIAYVLLFRGLSTLVGTGQYALGEVTSSQQSHSLRTIAKDPTNLPHKLLVWAGAKLGHHSVLVTRLASALLALPVAVLFYWLTLHWYSKRVAVLSTVLFICSSGFLHSGRYGGALLLQMATLVLTCSVVLYRRTKHEKLVAFLVTALVSVCLYIPGMVWFMAIEVFLLRKRIVRMMRRLGPLHASLLFGLAAVFSAPLLWAVWHNRSLARELAGLPATLPSLATIGENLVHLGSSIIYRGYWSPEYWLYGAPLLNIAEAVLFVIGLLLLVKRPILRSNYFTLSALVVGSLLVVVGGSATMALLIPLIYLVIAGGIYHLLEQWLSVFPRNPIARYAGIGLVTLLVLFSVQYHYRACFVVWPKAPETQAVYAKAP
jgi:hypothetical protein